MPDGFANLDDDQAPTPPNWRQRAHAHAANLLTHAKRRFLGVRWPLVGKIVAGVFVGLFALLAATTLFDWNALRGPVARMVSGALHRPVRIDGSLDVDLFTFTPRMEARGLVIGNPDWATRDAHLKGENVTVNRFAIETRLIPFIFGDRTLTRVEMDKPVINFYRAKDGRATWNFSGPANSEKPFSLPAIRHFLLRDGQLNLRDEKRELNLVAALASTESASANVPRPFELTGQGQLNNQPFQLVAAGGSLLNVRHDRPYPFNADIKAGGTHVVVRGQMNRPFDFGLIGAHLTVSGPDMSELYPLTGVTLPNTPPYNLTGVMQRVRTRFEFSNITGTVGDSDLSGQLAVDRQSNNRPMLTADLKSKQLDFDDLATVLGAPPSTARGETASAAQTTEARAMAANARLLPDAKLNMARVRNMDARVHYEADAVSTSMLPLRRASTTVTLDKGMLTLSPLAFSLPRGDITGHVRIDATGDVPDVDLDAKLTNARLEDFFTKKGIENAIEGLLQARVKLRGRGFSVHEAASHANGQVTFVAPKGEIRAAFAELLGINVTRGLGLLWSKDQTQIPVRCGVANFRAVDGVLHAQTIVFDTGTVIADGEGTVDLGQETLNLRLKGHPKEPRLVRVAAPITVQGTLRAPKLGVEAGKAAAQTGVAAVLGAVFTPLASILPFVDAGLADDADCGALLADAKQKGTPGKLATTAATPGK